MSVPPPIIGVIETCVYCRDLDAAEAFYGGILGLRKFWRTAHRDLFYAVGRSVLLIFNPEETVKGGMLPAHGATGPSHFALRIGDDQYDHWRTHLQAAGVAIEQEHLWQDSSARSLYFRDPAGNLVELITPPAWQKDLAT